MVYAIVGLNRWANYYQPKLLDNSMIISIRNPIIDKHLCWSFPKCFNPIRKSLVINGIDKVNDGQWILQVTAVETNIDLEPSMSLVILIERH